ncbi:MAG TPA: Calx-beta domain-containing protein [Chitinophagales bacterium]|nr:Calx-beta domain-containing protein [Chitinophagales bacterium]
MTPWAQTGPGGVGGSTDNKLWLRADAITGVADGGSVTTWSDQSGNGNDFTQSTASKKPTYTQSNSNFNNKPTVNFDGTSDFLDYGNGQMNATSVYSIFFVYKTTSTSSQYLFDTKTGKIRIPHEGGGDKAYNDGKSRGTEIRGTSTKLVEWELYDVSPKSSIYENGTKTQSGLSYSKRAINASTSLGANEAGNGKYFNGNIAEAIIYNVKLNSAQRIIVENYLGAKYGITIANDKYAYQATHENDVAGIGREDASNLHSAAESGGIFRVENPSSLGNGEYLLFGHDGASIASWSTSETPNTDIRRLTREWRLDETGDMGTVTMSLDTSLLPAKPSGFTKYGMLIDADGNFSSGAAFYPLTLSGGRYQTTGMNISDGDYVTFVVCKPVLSFSPTTGSAFESVTPHTVTISMNYTMSSNVTVDYVVTGGTATGGGTDFTLSNGTATITAGTTSATFSIAITNDAVIESDETIIIKIRNPSSGITLSADSTFTYTINDDDNSRKIQFASSSSSGTESNSSATVTISLNEADAANPTTVNYAVTGGTATGSGTDYTLASGTATIPANQTSTTISLSLTEDALDEYDETVIITLSSPSSNANLGANVTHTFTINDNDAAPSIAFSGTSSSGNESLASPGFSLSLSAVSGKTITVDYSATGGTAAGSGVDYTLANGTITIAAGETSGDIFPTIIDDSGIELSETIIVTLSNPVNATLGSDVTYTYTITDNDNIGPYGPGGVGDAAVNILWLRADYISGVADGGALDSWPDTSGNEFDPVQTNAANKPAYVASNVNFNNMPTVQFDGSSDYFDLTALTHAASDYTMVVVYKSTSTAKQTIFDSKTGKVEILHKGAGDKAYHDGTARGAEITGTGTQIVIWELDNAGSSVYINGSTSQSGLAYNQNPIGDNTTLGTRESVGDYFNGNIAEVCFYNTVLNTVQRKIVENYLGAKYNITISDDKYAYNATHGYDVAGIGSEGVPVIHTASASNYLLISNPSGLASGEYMLYGHDNASISLWTATETPVTEVRRLAREWRIDKTGDPGTVTITLDTTGLPAVNIGFNGFVVMVDADGNFSTGATIYSLISNGSSFSADNITLADGDYIAFGSARYLNITSGNFNSASNWHAGNVPGSGESAVILDNTTLTLTANQTAGSLTLRAGSYLNLSSYTLSIDEGTITNNGVISLGTSTINYSKTGAQTIAALTYNNLSTSGSGTKTIGGAVTVNGNLTIGNGTTLDASGYAMTVKGNWNNAGTFAAASGTVTFSGTSNQSVTSNGSTFYNLIVNNTATQISLNDSLKITNVLTLTDGVITTGSHRVIVASASASALTGHSSASFINGNLRRYITTNTNTYAFPVGNGTGTSNYYLAEIVNGSLSGISYIDSKFKPLTGHSDSELFVWDNWTHGYLRYSSICTEGVWELTPNASPTGGSYGVKLYIANMSGLTDNNFGPLKRPTGSTSGADWSTGGGWLNNDDTPGRTVASGYMQRSGLTGFSDFGGGRGGQGGSGLPIELLNFKAKAERGVVYINWTTATEINNDFFTIERSLDGSTFDELEIFDGAGNSSITREYAAVDRKPYPGTSYYRLKQTDFDGTATYSNMVSVFIETEKPVFTISPNPIKGKRLTIGLENSRMGIIYATLYLSDISGRTMFIQDLEVGNSQSIQIDLPDDLNSGVYFLNIRYHNELSRFKIVVS